MHERRRLEADRHAAANSPVFGQLFGAAMPVIYGQHHPRELLAELEAMRQLPEVELYREYVLGLWPANTAQWGNVPGSA